MKLHTPKKTTKLSTRKWLQIVLIGMIWVLLVTFIQLSQQIDTHKEAFNIKIKEFLNQQSIEQKKVETLLDALAEYYVSQPISPSVRLDEFMKGLSKQNHQLIFGQAKLITPAEKSSFEQQQIARGYESFSISNSGTFIEQEVQDSTSIMAITSIAPLTPKNSTFLSENLFSISGVLEQFNKAVQDNEAANILVTGTNTSQKMLLTFKPLFVSSVKNLNFKQRVERVRDAVFIIKNIEAELSDSANRIFAASPSETSSLSIDKTVIEQQPEQKLSSYFDWLSLSLTLSKQFESSSLQTPHTIHLSNNLGHYTLNKIYLLITAFITTTIYIIVVIVFLIISNYAQRIQQSQARVKQAMETSHDAVIITNEKGYVLEWNPEAERLFDYFKEEALGTCIAQLIFDLPDHLKGLEATNKLHEQQLIESFEDLLALNKLKPRKQRAEIPLKTKSDSIIMAEVSSSILHVKNQVEVSLFIKDISYRRQAEKAMTQLAYFDSLTELENRVYFEKEVENHIKANPETAFTILFMDLDGFKQVNDTLGHGIGDELLKVVAKRIKNTVRKTTATSHVCRFGGDEFVIMLDNTSEESAAQVSNRILNKVEKVIKINEDELEISTSIGLAFYPEHGTDINTLLRHADTAMYRSKEHGKNTFTIYHDSMEAHLAERTQIQKHLRSAVKNNEFQLVYQPQINLSTGQAVGVEALLRWHNPILGTIPPDKFIPIAEESPLILNIGDWVTDACINQLKSWKETPFQSLHIAMNVSSEQFEYPEFFNAISQKMHAAHLENQLLELEMTERTLMSNIEENITRFNEIRARGYGLSVDDFGTGYSSLSYLKKFPLSVLKIDKSFVDGIPNEEEDVSISTAILTLAHSLNIKVVAEGVETKDQLDFLNQLGCNYAQGYHISRPLPIYELEQWLKTNQLRFVSE